MSVRDGYEKTGDEAWPAVESISDDEVESISDDEQEIEELVSPDRVLRYLDVSERGVEAGQADDTDDGMLPRILSMPEGMTVDERLVGRAVAQWVLHVRCDCGRRWFEVEAVDTATCPRCGLLVYVDLDARSQYPMR